MGERILYPEEHHQTITLFLRLRILDGFESSGPLNKTIGTMARKLIVLI
jgi:hypothetical protein